MAINSKALVGGMMRCCIETISDDAEPEIHGRELKCRHCGDSVWFIDGYWRWYSLVNPSHPNNVRNN